MLQGNMIHYDWKAHAEIEELQEVLKKFGVYVYSADTKSDFYAWIFSDKPLTPEQVQEQFEIEWSK